MNRPNKTATLISDGRREINGEVDYVAEYRFDSCGHTRTEIFPRTPPTKRKLFCYECRNEEARLYGV